MSLFSPTADSSLQACRDETQIMQEDRPACHRNRHIPESYR